MRHSGVSESPKIEVIDSPTHASKLKKDFPYLDIRSILDDEHIGGEIINGLTGKPPQRFDYFDAEEQREILVSIGNGENWFDLWLNRKVEHHYIEIGNVATPKGLVEAFAGA